MRHIDTILEAIDNHFYLSPIEKIILKKRIEVFPTSEEIEEARKEYVEELNGDDSNS